MSCKYILAILVSVSLLQIEVFSQSTEKPPEKLGAIELAVAGTINMLNKTNAVLGSGLKSVVDIVFMPLEMIGSKAEDGIIGGTRIIGKIIGFVSKQVKGAAIKFQTKEEKFIGCVKSEQFDPVKKIFMDISSCVTSKAGTISNIVEKGLVQVNTTFSIVKSLTALPTCQGAKCLADYSSGIVGKIGQIGLGLASIGFHATTGLATIPITLPTCLLTQPALSPVKVFGLLGINIVKCVTA